MVEESKMVKEKQQNYAQKERDVMYLFWFDYLYCFDY